ncbi:hypothetical protein V6N13_137361 [Hibiscus sabdariffa]
MKTEQKPHLIKKLADVKCQRVDGSVAPGLEEATQVEHLLEEPKSEHVSLDRVLCFGKENLEKHLKMEDFFSCPLDYNWKINCGGLNGQGGDDLKLEVLDGLLDEVDEVDDIQAADDLSGACEDFQLDIECPERLSESDCAPHEGSKSSAATVQESNNQNGVLKKMFCGDLHHTFKSKFGCQAPVTDTIGPTIEHMQTFDESDDDEKPLVSFILSTKSVKSSFEVTKGGTLLRQKRLRKPTSRYIEEFSRNSTSGKKCLKAGSQGDLPQLVSEPQRQRGRPKKIVPKILRDKWRNLLRSSSAHEHNRRELQCETKPKHAVRPLPMPVVCRIHELATIHPYPMARCPKNHLIIIFLRPNNREQLKPFLFTEEICVGRSAVEESACSAVKQEHAIQV